MFRDPVKTDIIVHAFIMPALKQDWKWKQETPKTLLGLAEKARDSVLNNVQGKTQYFRLSPPPFFLPSIIHTHTHIWICTNKCVHIHMYMCKRQKNRELQNLKVGISIKLRTYSDIVYANRMSVFLLHVQ